MWTPLIINSRYAKKKLNEVEKFFGVKIKDKIIIELKKKVDKNLLDLYTDYLMTSTSLASATGLSEILDNQISHDKITRFLSSGDFKSKDLWNKVKPEWINMLALWS